MMFEWFLVDRYSFQGNCGLLKREGVTLDGIGVVDHLGDLGDRDVVQDMRATSGQFPVTPG